MDERPAENTPEAPPLSQQPQYQQPQYQPQPYQQQQIPQYSPMQVPQGGSYRATGGLKVWLIICIVFSVLALIANVILFAVYFSGAGSAYAARHIPRFDLWRVYAIVEMVLCIPILLSSIFMLRGKRVGFFIACIFTVLNAAIGATYYALAQYALPLVIWAGVAPFIGLLIIWLFLRKQWKWFV